MPTYVLTGANRGLGLEFVRQLSASKENTILAGVRDPKSDLSDLNSIIKDKSNIHVLKCDTSSLSSIATFGSECTKALGGSESAKIDYIINNAGINAVPDCSILSIPEDSFNDHMMINILGPAKLVEHLHPHLGKGAAIMNLTSGLASMQKGRSMAKCPVYSISKAGINMLTVQQAAALKDKGVCVICMDPGWVKTRMGGEGAFLEPDASIGGMLKVLHGLKVSENTAKFYTYTGEEVPW